MTDHKPDNKEEPREEKEEKETMLAVRFLIRGKLPDPRSRKGDELELW